MSRTLSTASPIGISTAMTALPKPQLPSSLDSSQLLFVLQSTPVGTYLIHPFTHFPHSLIILPVRLYSILLHFRYTTPHITFLYFSNFSTPSSISSACVPPQSPLLPSSLLLLLHLQLLPILLRGPVLSTKMQISRRSIVNLRRS